MRCFGFLHGYDQVDCCALPGREIVRRWRVQTEMAVERSHSAPDYQGLDIVAGAATLRDGRASTEGESLDLKTGTTLSTGAPDWSRRISWRR